MVSGLAPGSLADTLTVGKSTFGNGATGSIGNAASPANAIASMISVVATGRRINGAEIHGFAGGRSALGAAISILVLLSRYWPLTTMRSPG
jgi:hypothetical protein